jgi:hypothetical protein
MHASDKGKENQEMHSCISFLVQKSDDLIEKNHAKPMRKTSKTFDPVVVAQLYALPI